jgi:TrmH family RNA methyltransferase
MIFSPSNERIRRYRRLRKKKFRYREGKFLVEGLQAVVEALRHERKPECLICSRKGIEAMQAYADVFADGSVPCYAAEDNVISTLSSTVTPQGIIAISPMLDVDIGRLAGEKYSTILVANRVRDPGNLGNMIRIADASGCDGIVVCRESADPYNPKTVRSTAGSLFHVPLVISEGIGEAVLGLKDQGYLIYTADAHRGTNMWEAAWPKRLALVVGNEAWGIPEEEEELADEIVHVPVYGRAESLNVSSAAALLLYEVERRRALRGPEEGNEK